MIELRMLGRLSLTGADGREVRGLLGQPRRLALLAYLAAASPQGFHRRDTLLALFWPELDQEHARAALRQALHVVRDALGGDAVTSRGDEEIGPARWKPTRCSPGESPRSTTPSPRRRQGHWLLRCGRACARSRPPSPPRSIPGPTRGLLRSAGGGGSPCGWAFPPQRLSRCWSGSASQASGDGCIPGPHQLATPKRTTCTYARTCSSTSVRIERTIRSRSRCSSALSR